MIWEQLRQAAREQGIGDLQVEERGRHETSLGLFEGNVDSFTVSDTKTWTIKGLYQGHMGSVVMEAMDEDLFPFIIDAIKDSAQAISGDDVETLYEGDGEYPKIAYTENQCLHEPITKKIAVLKDLEQRLANSDPRIAQVMEVEYQDLVSETTLMNTKGLHISKQKDLSLLSAAILVKDRDDQKSAQDVVLLRSLKSFDTERFIEHLKTKGIAKLHAQNIPSGMYPTIIKNKAMADLLACLITQFHGEHVAKGISLLKDRLHETIFDEKVTLVDDPLMVDGVNSTPFDDEGVACRKKNLVENGKLRMFLHNLRSAERMHTSSTGNGFARDIAPTNLYLENGTSSFTDMVHSMNEGVIIDEVVGLHAGWNTITTQFSLQASGFYVKDGVIAHPLNLITIAGNFLSLMKEISMIGSDLEHFYTGVGSPSVLFTQIAISGEGEKADSSN